jgi:hypothetical protein
MSSRKRLPTGEMELILDSRNNAYSEENEVEEEEEEEEGEQQQQHEEEYRHFGHPPLRQLHPNSSFHHRTWGCLLE